MYISASGGYVGGYIKDKTENIDLLLFNTFRVNNIHIILAIFLVLVLVGIAIISRVKEDKSKPLRYVVSRVVRPGVFRTFTNMGTLSGTTNSTKIEKTLRSIDGDENDIAVDDIIARLYDPDSEVREEAARALGRIKSIDAVKPLLKELNDEQSTIRSQAAIALGKIGDKEALPALFKALESSSEDLQNAAIKALGMLGSDKSIKNLLKIFSKKSEVLEAASAIAVSELGVLEAAWDIIPKMHSSQNPVLTKQLSISIANLLGNNGEFYKYITGSDASRLALVKSLFSDIPKNLEKLVSCCSEYKLSADDKKNLTINFKTIENLFIEKNYVACFTELKKSVISIIKFILIYDDEEVEEESYLEKLFPRNQKIGIWWWFVTQAFESQENSTPQVIKLDILITLYFISTFK